jgi:hypothetical protein
VDGSTGDYQFENETEDLGEKCRKAGYESFIFEEDHYNFENWQYSDPIKKVICNSASANARGIYTSHLVPCTFQFYYIPEEQVLDPFVMSTACSGAGPVENGPEVEQYVVKWPDECAADFDRCYVLERDERLIILRHLCKYMWEIPEGITHMSVNCTADTQEKEEHGASTANKEGELALSDRDKYYLKYERNNQRGIYIVFFVAIFICICSGCISLRCAYRYAIEPYLTAFKQQAMASDRLATLKTEEEIDRNTIEGHLA